MMFKNVLMLAKVKVLQMETVLILEDTEDVLAESHVFLIIFTIISIFLKLCV